MKVSNEPRKLWSGGVYGAPYQYSGARLIERLSPESLAAVSTTDGRSIKQLLDDAGVRA